MFKLFHNLRYLSMEKQKPRLGSSSALGCFRDATRLSLRQVPHVDQAGPCKAAASTARRSRLSQRRTHTLGCQPAEDRCARRGGRATQCLGLCRGRGPDPGREQRPEVTKANSADLQRPEWGPLEVTALGALLCTDGESGTQKAERTWSKSCGKFLRPRLPH